MENRFRVDFLEPAKAFVDGLEERAREKVLYNIWKARSVKDNELFKKLNGEIWEFRTVYKRQCYRLLAFWDKTDTMDTLVIATNGFLKKTNKTPVNEIERAENLRGIYFREKLER